MNYENKEKSPDDLQFEEELQYSTQPPIYKNRGLIPKIIKYSGGYIKDEKQATYLILGFIVTIFIISLFLVFNSGGIKEIDFQDIPLDQQ